MTPAILFLAITSASCPPCAALHRDFDGDARIEWRDATPETRREWNVTGVPTVIAVRDGREVGRHKGYQGRTELRKWMASMEAQDARTHRALPPAASRPAARH